MVSREVVCHQTKDTMTALSTAVLKDRLTFGDTRIYRLMGKS